MSKLEIKQEARHRQGKHLDRGRRFFVTGGSAQVTFDMGKEGLVFPAVETATQMPYRIKCFGDPNQVRLKRSRVLVLQQLADLRKAVADALGGAPFEVIENIEDSPSIPFAVVMKNVQGLDWKHLREEAKTDTMYPPSKWPPIEVRATWAYGLATAVKNMEAREFVHADLSPGNVMVTPDGDSAGDMALVDFDGFVHPSYPHLDTTIKGSPGYAAAEIWQGQSVRKGSDRIAMAALIQEFLLVGDPAMRKGDVVKWIYANNEEEKQEREILSGRGDAQPLFAEKYPELAKLLTETLRSRTPERRPEPEAWRSILRPLAEGKLRRTRLRKITLEPHPINRDKILLPFDDTEARLDLFLHFGIRALLERQADGTVDLSVYPGAELRVQLQGSSRWHLYQGRERAPATAGMVLFDRDARVTVRLSGEEY